MAFAAGQFESVLRQSIVKLFHFTGIGDVDLCLVRREADDFDAGYPFSGAQPRAQCRPILNGIKPGNYGEVRAGVLNRRNLAIRSLVPLARCLYRRLGEDNIGLVQQPSHRSWIEMKRDVGEVARRVAPLYCRLHC